jgi:hypothetical protein
MAKIPVLDFLGNALYREFTTANAYSEAIIPFLSIGYSLLGLIARSLS